jgi:hypothetical protein
MGGGRVQQVVRGRGDGGDADGEATFTGRATEGDEEQAKRDDQRQGAERRRVEVGDGEVKSLARPVSDARNVTTVTRTRSA